MTLQVRRVSTTNYILKTERGKAIGIKTEKQQGNSEKSTKKLESLTLAPGRAEGDIVHARIPSKPECRQS